MSDTKTEKPAKTCKGVTFIPVPEFTDVDAAFGAKAGAFFNRYDLPNVPSTYRNMASSLFFSGGKLPQFIPGVDRAKAVKAIRAWLSSFAPAHESKEATVGYALWVWTEGDDSAA
jgi:hypothetical protein